MTYYLQNGTSYSVTDEANISISTSLPVGNYIVKKDQFGNFFLDKVDNFTAPKKLYGDMLKNVDRILTTFFDRQASTGVMLVGEKGSGKTLLGRVTCVIAAKRNVPTILINTPFYGDAFNQFIQSIDQRCIIIIDEFEKLYDSEKQESILTLLDGVFQTQKLFIITSNDKWRVDKHMRNRPGRIYYMIEFKGLDMSFIKEYCNDTLKNKNYIDAFCKTSTLFDQFNFDMLKALVEEMNRYNESPQEALRMLNAKPEFSNNAFYDVQLLINNMLLPKDNVLTSKWSGNPFVSTITLQYHVDDISDIEGNESSTTDYWTEIEFNASNLNAINASEGKFIFKNDKGLCILTKIYENSVNYLGLF